MASARLSARGFSLSELLLVVAVAATLMAIAVPFVGDVGENFKLSAAAREIERELQAARLKAVSSNRRLRVRLNCPSAGFVRTVEVLATSADDASNRCLTSAYPYPPADQDVMTRPNFDGPVRILPNGATVTLTDPADTMTKALIEFRPDGTAVKLVNTTIQAIATPITVTVTRNNKSRSMTINGAGKIQIQQ
jgi:prepilin-type N-terminal cleavage/methylation domain-containing protein